MNQSSGNGALTQGNSVERCVIWASAPGGEFSSMKWNLRLSHVNLQGGLEWGQMSLPGSVAFHDEISDRVKATLSPCVCTNTSINETTTYCGDFQPVKK